MGQNIEAICQSCRDAELDRHLSGIDEAEGLLSDRENEEEEEDAEDAGCDNCRVVADNPLNCGTCQNMERFVPYAGNEGA